MTYSPTRSIENTVAVITGASAGIGKAAAHALVAAGARVALGAGEKTASTLWSSRWVRTRPSLSPATCESRATTTRSSLQPSTNGVTSTPWWRMRGSALRRHHRPR